MKEHAAALNVTKKAVTEPGTLVSSFDQARNIGQHELATAQRYDTELRLQGSEWIIGYLWPGRAYRSQEGRPVYSADAGR